MDVVRDLRNVPGDCQNAVLAIGNFDGVHRGHQALLADAKDLAEGLSSRVGVMVFEPHPRAYFQPNEPHFRLTSLDEKLRLLEHYGVDFTVVVPFDQSLANLSAEDFCKRILAEALKVRHVVIGYNFYFGKNRGGSPEFLKDCGKRLGFKATIVAAVAEDGAIFSSTEIRLKLAQGDVTGAAHVLGRWWRVTGPVVGGAHRGTGLGFPTANIPMPKGTAIAHGIYAVRTRIGGEIHDGAAYLGTRPTFDDGKPVLEVFLFDFDGDIYGQDMTVEFIGFIRPDRKFDTPEALIAQMDLDCAQARDLLAKTPEYPA